MEFNPFDVTTKELVWDGPAAWLDRFGIGPPGPVEVIDSDITTPTPTADKVIKVGGPEPYLVNLEFQSSHDRDLVETTWFRQAALDHRHKLPILGVLVLLRRDANSPSFTGSFEIRMRDGWQMNLYNDRAVRMWAEDPEPYLTSAINLVPLAPITNVTAHGATLIERGDLAFIETCRKRRLIKRFLGKAVKMDCSKTALRENSDI